MLLTIVIGLLVVGYGVIGLFAILFVRKIRAARAAARAGLSTLLKQL